jgi:hypothetical protein
MATKNHSEGRRVIEHLVWLQNELGRALHPVAIGASQFTEYLAIAFIQFTLLDSRPFMNAVKRKVILGATSTLQRADWVHRETQDGEPIDDILFHNIQEYTSWILTRCEAVDSATKHFYSGNFPNATHRLS